MTSGGNDTAREIVEENPEIMTKRNFGASHKQPLVEIELKEGTLAKDAEDPKGQADS